MTWLAFEARQPTVCGVIDKTGIVPAAGHFLEVEPILDQILSSAEARDGGRFAKQAPSSVDTQEVLHCFETNALVVRPIG